MNLTVLILAILLFVSDSIIIGYAAYMLIQKKKDDDAKKSISNNIKSESLSDIVRDANHSADTLHDIK